MAEHLRRPGRGATAKKRRQYANACRHMLKVKSYNERDNRRTCGFGFATVGQHNRGGAADGRLTEQPWDGAKEVQTI